MHDEIIRFSLAGHMGDTSEKERLVRYVEEQMRDYGCVPSIDLNPQFTVDYQPDAELFEFDLTVYGIYVGGSEAWHTSGVTDGKMILKYTPPIRSSRS